MFMLLHRTGLALFKEDGAKTCAATPAFWWRAPVFAHVIAARYVSCRDCDRFHLVIYG